MLPYYVSEAVFNRAVEMHGEIDAARIALEAATTLIEKLAIKQHIEIMTAARRALLGV